MATSLLHTLPSTLPSARHHHRLLRGVVVERGLDRKHLKGLCRHVELGDAGLEHHGEPQIAVAVRLEIERAGRRAGFLHRHGVFPVRAGLGIELAEKILDEIGIPDIALRVGAHVVRRDGLARQVVFGDDDVGGAALGPRQGLQRVRPGRPAAQIHRRQIGGELAHQIVMHLALGEPRLQARLRRVVGILRHALEHGEERLGIVGRAHDALEGMAAHAFDQRPLLLRRAGHAHEPLGIGQLRREIGGLAQLERDFGRGGAKLDRLRAIELVADGANAQRVMAGRRTSVGKAKTAVLVADHGDGDSRAGRLRADQHALHRAFLGRAHRTGQSLRTAGAGLPADRSATTAAANKEAFHLRLR